MLQILNHLCGPLLDMLQYVHDLLALESPSPGTAAQMWLSKADQRGKDDLS